MDVSASETQQFILKYDNLSDFADLLCATVDLVKRGQLELEKDMINHLSMFEKLYQFLYNMKVHGEPTALVPLYDEVLLKAALKYVRFCRSITDPNKKSLFYYKLCDEILEVIFRFILLKKTGPNFCELALEYFEEVAQVPTYNNGNNNYVYLLEFVLRTSSNDFVKANLEVLVKSIFFDHKTESVHPVLSSNDFTSGWLYNYQNSVPDLLAEVVFGVGELSSENMEDSDWNIKLRAGQGKIFYIYFIQSSRFVKFYKIKQIK